MRNAYDLPMRLGKTLPATTAAQFYLLGPTTGTDARGPMVGEVLDTMRLLSQEGMTMILVTHEMRFAREVSDRVAFFRSGVMHEIGSAEQVFTDPRQPETAAFLKSVL